MFRLAPSLHFKRSANFIDGTQMEERPVGVDLLTDSRRPVDSSRLSGFESMLVNS